jgi:hypothetical protein
VNWFGWVVLADIPDPDGKPCGHAHPAMVLRGPGDDGGLWLIAISTSFDKPNRNEFWIECDWAPGGHPVTGLTQPCVLKCDWVVALNRSQLKDFLGEIPVDIALRASDLALRAFERRQRPPN